MNIPVTLNADFYKESHYAQYSPHTEVVYSTWTPRKSRMSGIDKVVFFGLQYFIKEFLIDNFNKTFFNRPKEEVISEFKRIMKNTIGNDYAKHWEDLHDLGYLPLKICALPEGTLTPIRCPMFTIENTLPEFYWLTNFIETVLSTMIWKPMTSATIALEYRKILDKWAEKTCDNNAHVDYQAHDFAYRGLAGIDGGMSSGAGHLLSFKGTDTIPAILFFEKYYNANVEKECVGCSIAATEHSVAETNIIEIQELIEQNKITLGNEYEGWDNRKIAESLYMERLFDVYKSGFFSYVGDTYNLWAVIRDILPIHKDKIMNRDGRMVIRPDCYDEQTQILTDKGWKYFKDLEKNIDKVAQYHEDGSIDFVLPVKYYDEYYEGDMYEFSNFKHNMDLFVTPNHRMVYRRRKNKSVEINFAENMNYSFEKLSLHAGKKFGSINKLTPKEKLLIAIQADGRFRCGENSTKFIVDFQFAKKRKIDKLIAICEEGGYKYKLIENSRQYNGVNNKWNNQSTIYVYLNEKPTKNLREWVNLQDKSYLWCREFISEAMNWDGSIRTESRFKYDSTDKDNAEMVQLIAILAGYRTKYTIYKDNRSEKFKDTHTVNIVTGRDYLDGQVIKKEVKKYCGHVYCVQVPTGMIIVRRNNQVVISGNSGIPEDILCGLNTKTEYDDLRNCEKSCQLAVGEYAEQINKGVIELLWDIFGGTVNDKGYKVLDSHIGCIYGDAITLERAEEICKRLESKGFASSNVVFGVGSFTYQFNTRDTFGFALKTTYGKVNGKELLLYKDPFTDDGTKKSQKGMVSVFKDEQNNIVYKDELNAESKNCEKYHDLLQPVFENGNLLVDVSLNEIRERVRNEK